MSDLLLTYANNAADLTVRSNDIAQDGGLETAVLLSLFTDRRAELGDVLPEADTDRRGWWGDAFPEVEGDKIGSRLWLLARSKQTPDVLSRAEEYAREALAWLTEDKVAASVTVRASVPRPGVLGLEIAIQRPEKDIVQFRFDYTWASQEARRI